MDNNDKIDMLTGKKENPALSKMLGKKLDEKADKESIVSKIIGKAKTYEDELRMPEKTIKCPKCGHEFSE